MRLIKYKIYIPSFVTSLSILLSVGAICTYLYGNATLSFSLFILAFVFDILDGFLARYLNAETKVGAWLDSVSDVFLYLLFPAIIIVAVYEPVLYLWLSVSVFVLSGVARLYRFTLEGFVAHGAKVGYRGLPVFVTMPITTSLLLFEDFVTNNLNVCVFGILLFALSIAMVSKVFIPKIINRTVLMVGVLMLLSVFVYSVIK